MNIHYLELFYYVAKFGGISEAVRNIPYGIQQPAISGQVIQLEDSLGLTLFQRRPFLLTPAGEELYEFIRPFFDNIDRTAEKLRGGVSQHIRIGASEIVLRDYLPEILQTVRAKFPKLSFSLREGYQPELENKVARQEIDLAITLLEGKPPSGVTALSLMRLPLVLLVAKGSKVKSAKELWARDHIDEPLISLPTSESIYKNFQRTLAPLHVEWFSRIEVSSIALVESYAAHGYGIGLSIAIPKAKPHPELRVLPLEDFNPVSLGVMWHGKSTPIIQTFVTALQQAAKALGGAAIPPACV